MSKNLMSCSLLFCSLLLASCGSSSQSPQDPKDTHQQAAEVLTDTPKELVLWGNPSGQNFSGDVASLNVANGALSQDVNIKVTRLDPASAPKLPAVDGIYATYLLGEVEGSHITGAWRVQMDNAEFKQIATLEVKPEANLSKQSMQKPSPRFF